MKSYAIHRPDAAQRHEILTAFPSIAALPEPMQDQVLTAWASTWLSSDHTRLNDAPFSRGAEYPLVTHVNEVVEAGISLQDMAARRWNQVVDQNILLAILLLHDVDKPLLYTRTEAGIVTTEVYRQIPHGVLGALLLAELGMDETIIAAVATHAVNAPFRGVTPESYLLHYADMFCADHALMSVNLPPFFATHS
jgi:hypothetical protein